MLTGKGVLFVGNNAEQVSKAVFSAFSLFAPLRFSDSLLIYTGLGDQRFADVICNSTKWKVVGTTNILAAERCKQFEVVVKLPNKPLSKNPDLRQAIQKKTNRLMKKCELQMNKSLEIDSYFDLLDRKLQEKQMQSIIQGTDFTIDDIKRVMETSTFSDWRKSVLFRSQFRL